MSNRVLAGLGAIIVFAALCLRLGYMPLVAPDEGRNAEVGREMKESGAWLVPTYNGIDYLDKPAFYFKCVAVSLSLFGNNETAARLPSAAFGVALVLLTFAFCRKVYGMRCGLLAAIIVATMPLFLSNSRTVIFDIALAFFVCGAIFAGYLAEVSDGRSRRNWYWLGAASAGVATLVKGPVGFLIPVLVLLVFNRIEGRRGVWRRLFAPLNFVIFFAITLPWFVGLCLIHRDFFQYGIVEESFHRFTTAKAFHRSEPFYFYGLIVATMFLPWSLLLPEAGIATWKERWTRRAAADRLCVVWSVLVVIFFSISQSKLPGYILSVTVACGILIARLFDVALGNPASRTVRIIQRATAAFAVLCLVASALVMAGASQTPRLSKVLRIPIGDAERLSHWIVPFAVVLALFGVCAIAARFRRNLTWCFLSLALFTPICANVNVNAFNVILEAKSGRRIAAQLANLSPGTEIACLNCFANGVPFYLGRTLTLISDDGAELTSNYIIYTLKKTSDWPKQIVPLASFDTWLASRRTPVYLMVQKRDRARLQAIAEARHTTVEVLSPSLFGARLPAPEVP